MNSVKKMLLKMHKLINRIETTSPAHLKKSYVGDHSKSQQLAVDSKRRPDWFEATHGSDS